MPIWTLDYIRAAQVAGKGAGQISLQHVLPNTANLLIVQSTIQFSLGILAEAGLSMNNVVKTVIFLADINDFAAVNAVYAKAFAEPFPARSCVQVAAIPKGAKLEIECIAVRE